jgi:cytoskeletal protein RodZ
MSYGKSTNSNHEDRSTCSLQKKRVLLGYTQLGLVVIICFILGIVLPAEFQVVTASQKVQVVFRSAETGVGQHDEYHHHHEQVQQQHASESNGTSSLDTGKPPSLQIAWLMSFPNSGTSYTQKMIRHVTLTRTASNYGNEAKGSKGASITVFADQPTGPFWQDTHIHPEYTLPTDYALTKTHCGGRCENCPPTKVRALSAFLRSSAKLKYGTSPFSQFH